jgi:hypothetical protein
MARGVPSSPMMSCDAQACADLGRGKPHLAAEAGKLTPQVADQYTGLGLDRIERLAFADAV